MNECRHPFALYMLGAESPHWRKLLTDNGARHVGINFKSLLPRMNKAQVWSVAEHFDAATEILVDGGSHGAQTVDDFDHDAHALMYQHWVEANIERISLVVEYDAPVMGLEWVTQQRTYWDGLIPADKFLPVWHEEYGVPELERLAEVYERVAISKPAGGLESRIRAIVARHGVKVHGLGISGPDDIEQIPLATASSTSWISPSRYGDTQIFSGGRFHWYPARSKKDARVRHHHDVDLAGFSGDDYEAGDAPTVARYTVWAWQQFENDIMAQRGRPDAQIVAITRPVTQSTGSTQDPGFVAQSETFTRSPQLIVRERDQVFPGLKLKTQKSTSGAGGGGGDITVPDAGDSNLRQCNSCSLRVRCPAFAVDSSCAFKMPLEIRTKEQLQASMSLLLEMHLGRILFAKAVEEAEGHPVNPDVTLMIEGYFKMVAKWKEIETDSTFLSIKASGPAAGGIISSLLGQARGAEARAVAQAIDPTKAERVIRNFVDMKEDE